MAAGVKNSVLDILTATTQLVQLPSLLVQSSTKASTVNGKAIYQACWECEDHFALRLMYVGQRHQHVWANLQRSNPCEVSRASRSLLAELVIEAVNAGKYRMHAVLPYEAGHCWACAETARAKAGKRFRKFFGHRDYYLGLEHGRTP